MHIVDASPLYWTIGVIVGCGFALGALARDKVAIHRITAAVFLAGLFGSVVLGGVADLVETPPVTVLHGIAATLWIAGSLGFGAVAVLRVGVWLRAWLRAPRRFEAPGRNGVASLLRFVRSTPDLLVKHWWTWPFVVATGVILALARAEALTAEASGELFAVLLVLTAFGYMASAVVAELREVSRKIALKDLVLGVLMCEATALIVTFGWPAPDTTLFGVLAQINATLFVAAAIPAAAPRAWARTLRMHVAWITLAPLTAALGLVASIGGALDSGYSPRLLLALSMGSVMPVAMALLYGLYAKLRPGVGDALDEATQAAFKTAYVRGGGEATLGNPTGRATVSPGRGAVQEFAGGKAELAGIVALWDTPPVVLRGDAWQTFVRLRTDESADLLIAYELAGHEGPQIAVEAHGGAATPAARE